MSREESKKREESIEEEDEGEEDENEDSFLEDFEKEMKEHEHPSKDYRRIFYMDINHTINESRFYDRGVEKKFKELEEKDIMKEEFRDIFFEVTLCDLEKDTELKKWLETLEIRITGDNEYKSFFNKSKKLSPKNFSEVKDPKKNYEFAVLKISDLLVKEVYYYYGGRYSKEMEEKLEQLKCEIHEKRKNNIILLSEVRNAGLCRHRSILFKLLCDHFGIPCRVLRGMLVVKREVKKVKKSGKRDREGQHHSWNEIVPFASNPGKFHLVDCMNFGGIVHDGLRMKENFQKFYKERYGIEEFAYINSGHPLSRTATQSYQKTVEYVCKNYETLKGGSLGHGGMGTVYELNESDSDTIDTKQLAVKETILDPSVSKYIKKEMEILTVLNHENIVEVLGSFMISRTDKVNYVERYACMVMKKYLHDGRKFHDMVKNGKAVYENAVKSVKQQDVLKYLLKILKGLSYIHSFGIVHYDIKPQNILVNFEEDSSLTCVRIADFNCCKGDELNNYLTTMSRRTPKYSAPEVQKVMDNPNLLTQITKKCDIFSFGKVMSEFSFLFPADCQDTSNQIFTDLVAKCTNENEPIRRPDVPEIISELKRLYRLVAISFSTSLKRAKYYFQIGLHEESLKYYELCRKNLEKLEKRKLRQFYFEMGETQRALGMFDKTLSNYEKSLEAVNENEKDRYSKAVQSAVCMSRIGRIKKTIYESLESKLSCEKKSIEKKRGNALFNLGCLYYRKDAFLIALEYFQKCLLCRKELGKGFSIAKCYERLGVCQRELGLIEMMKNSGKGKEYLEDSRKSLKECLNLYRELGLPNNNKNVITIQKKIEVTKKDMSPLKSLFRSFF